MKKIIGYTLLALLVIIQFFKPEKNISTGPTPNQIGNKYAVPADVDGILKKACYDCHSNNTAYPWYNNIQPVAWWLNSHVQEGKDELNLSEFLSYSPKKARHKMVKMADVVKDGFMPLGSYTWIHTDAKLNAEEKLALSGWADAIAKQIATENNLPAEEPKGPGRDD